MKAGRPQRLRLARAALVLCVLLLAGPVRAGAQADPSRDPWQGMNRAIFAFNDAVYTWFLDPIAKGWDFVLPDPVQTHLQLALRNAEFPVVFLNDLLQLKPLAAAEDLGAFALNSVCGIGGLFDAAREVGWAQSDEDFGQTLGSWGVPAGPYLVLPLLGPSSPRHTAGRVADSFSNPYRYFVPFYVNTAIGGTDVLNARSLTYEVYEEEKQAAFDFYVAVRNAYVQNRNQRVNDRQVPAEKDEQDDEDDLYYFEDEEGDVGS